MGVVTDVYWCGDGCELVYWCGDGCELVNYYVIIFTESSFLISNVFTREVSCIGAISLMKSSLPAVHTKYSVFKLSLRCD